MMTYEQFLKQLRSIGTSFMITGFGCAVMIITATLLRIIDFEKADNALLLCLFLFIVGTIIYPPKSEE